MKAKEYKPNYLFNNLLAAIRKEIQKAITEAVTEIAKTCGTRFEVENTTLWNVMYESAYVPVLVNDSGEFTYLRNEKVAGALQAAGEDDVRVITETGVAIDIDELCADDLSAVYAFVDEIRQRLESGEFTCDHGVVTAVDIETE